MAYWIYGIYDFAVDVTDIWDCHDDRILDFYNLDFPFKWLTNN